MRSTVTAAVVIMCLARPAVAQETLGHIQLEIGTPVSMTTGQVRRPPTVGLELTLNEPVTFYAFSGATMCDQRMVSRERPASAGYGWEVRVLPVGFNPTSHAVRAEVTWTRRWEGETSTTGAPHGPRTLIVGFGQGVTLDFMPGNDRDTCDEIGMGLELRLFQERHSEEVLAEMWLVRTADGGDETLAKQVYRGQLGASYEFAFNNMPPGSSGETMQLSGLFTPNREASDGGLEGVLRLDRRVVRADGESVIMDGTTTYALVADEDDVLSFELPGALPTSVIFRSASINRPAGNNSDTVIRGTDPRSAAQVVALMNPELDPLFANLSLRLRIKLIR